MCIEQAINYVGCGHRDIDLDRCEAAVNSGKAHTRGHGLRQTNTLEKEGRCAECAANSEKQQQKLLKGVEEQTKRAANEKTLQPKGTWATLSGPQKGAADEQRKLVTKDQKKQPTNTLAAEGVAQSRSPNKETRSRSTKQRHQNEPDEQRRQNQAERLQRRFFGGPHPRPESPKEVPQPRYTNMYEFLRFASDSNMTREGEKQTTKVSRPKWSNHNHQSRRLYDRDTNQDGQPGASVDAHEAEVSVAENGQLSTVN
ncbi:hypothetical protein LTR37_005466 [Vermiconidia calcicola]|uniref:Uncharacterized protein n=1 Tax=Vermiconidia calcicola TaxID=1690605 RepID=A0ACC3NJP8_9PEZI|nr:hypothetical protein LTR37_005466 [Vermiconidia calcicola]